MKYLLTLLAGMLLGAALFFAGMFFNPFADRQSVSPLSVTDEEHLDFTYTAVPGEAILYTDNGESIIETHPDRVAELWEPAVVDTRIAVYVLNDSRGEVRGLGIKFSTDSEQTALIKSEILFNSIWHIYVLRAREPCSSIRLKITGHSCAKSWCRRVGVRATTGWEHTSGS
jgi:hypothetical protein